MAVPLRSKGALSDWINLKRVRPAEQPFPSRKGSNIKVRRGSNEALPDFRTQATEAALSTTSPRSENFQNACPVIPSRCRAILAVSHRVRRNQGAQRQWTHPPSSVRTHCSPSLPEHRGRPRIGCTTPDAAVVDCATATALCIRHAPLRGTSFDTAI